MNNWIKVFASNQLIEAEMIKSILIENDIEAVLVNKIDASYLFGQAEIFVMPENAIKSKNIINSYFKNE